MRTLLGHYGHFRPEWKPHREDDDEGYREQSLSDQINHICNTPDKYDPGIRFDLCMDTDTESFLTSGAGVETAR